MFYVIRNVILNLFSMFLTVFCLAVYEMTFLCPFLFSISSACYFYESNMFIIFKVILVAIFGLLSFFCATALPLMWVYPIKYVCKYACDISSDSKIMCLVFCIMLAVFTYFHYNIDYMNYAEKDIVETVINIWNLVTIPTIVIGVFNLFEPSCSSPFFYCEVVFLDKIAYISVAVCVIAYGMICIFFPTLL